MKRRIVALITTIAGVIVVNSSIVKAKAQESFMDVPTSDWAYRAVTQLQHDGILFGYPAEYFAGKRTLSRYEFAIAIKRAVDSLLPGQLSMPGVLVNSAPGSISVVGNATSGVKVNSAAAPPPPLTVLVRLIDEFNKDLTNLHVDVGRLKTRLTTMPTPGSKTALGKDGAQTIDSGQDAGHAAVKEAVTRFASSGFDLDYGRFGGTYDTPADHWRGMSGPSNLLYGGFSSPALITLGEFGSRTSPFSFSSDYAGGNYPEYGLKIVSRLGNTTASMFAGNSYGPAGGPSAFGSPSPYGDGLYPGLILPTITDRLAAGALGVGLENRNAGVQVTLPLFNVGTIGGSIVNFSDTGVLAPSNASVLVSGVNFDLKMGGRMNLSGGAARSTNPNYNGGSDSASPGDPDSSAYNLKLRYNAGPIGVLGGFQYVNAGFAAPGAWNSIGSWINPTNVQGTFVKVNYNMNPRTAFQVGGDVITGAQNRSFSYGSGVNGVLGPHDSINRITAGMNYKLWDRASLTADWQGVYWDLSSSSSILGVESRPFESYLNLGTGFSLRDNTTLSFGYRIGTLSNFGGVGALSGAANGTSYNAFTTQLNVKF